MVKLFCSDSNCSFGSVLLSEQLSKESNDAVGKLNTVEMKVSMRVDSKQKLNMKLKDSSKKALKSITGSRKW